MKLRAAPGAVILPRVTKVFGFATMIPAFLSPRNAIKRPIPAVIAPPIRERFDDFLSQSRYRKKKEDESAVENQSEGRAPRNILRHADMKREEGIDSHSRRHSDGIIGPDSHEDGEDAGGQRRDGDQSFEVHSSLRQDLGMDHENIGHGRESGQTGEDFSLQTAATSGELEASLQRARNGRRSLGLLNVTGRHTRSWQLEASRSQFPSGRISKKEDR